MPLDQGGLCIANLSIAILLGETDLGHASKQLDISLPLILQRGVKVVAENS